MCYVNIFNTNISFVSVCLRGKTDSCNESLHRVHIQGLRGMRDSCNESLIVQIYMISHNIRLANFAGNSLSPWHLRAA